ncbi:hypothetical protein AB2T14_001145 [Clostridium botulinum]
MENIRGPDIKEQAKKDYLQGMKYKDLALKYEVSLNTIKSWVKRHGWSEEKKQKGAHKKKKGAPLNNKNAVGHGAPAKNKNAEKHGFFSKYLPEETLGIMEEIETKKPLDILWEQIMLQYAAIIRAQKIMHVTDKDEMIKELKKEENFESDNSSSSKIEYEFQFAWDRQATFLNAQSRAMGELRSLIKQYDELLHKNWNLATEEQKARIEVLRSKIVNNEKSKEDKIDEYFYKLEEGIKNAK